MDLCVVIPVHNEEKLLGEQLDALLAQTWDRTWEILVVDNGSSDGTAALVQQFASRTDNLRLLGAHDKPDKAYAVNTAIASSNASTFAVCDADDVVGDGWVAAVGNALQRHPVVTGPNELDRLNPPWLADSRGRSADELRGSFAGIFPCIRGNNWGFQRDVLGVIGPPLREGYFGAEDVEFSLRCWLHGIDIAGLPDALVHYRYRSSIRDLWHQGWLYGSKRPGIARLLRDAGKPLPPRFGGWKSWAMLLILLPRVFTRSGRARWVWTAGNRFGRIAGSIRHRVLML